MTDHALTQDSPLISRIKAWSDERFPLAHGVGYFALYLTAAAVARYAGDAGEIKVALTDILACLVAFSYFLLLRVFDEHKDYELDCMNHPQRVLQSGLITLKHLKVLGGLSIAAHILWSLWLDRGFSSVTLAWFIAFAWTCLMGKEFFCGEWLEKRLTLYAFSHMLVMPMIMWWFMQMGHPGVAFGKLAGILLGLSFASGFAAEIVRKTRGPEEERDTVDSYSKIFGTRGAAIVVMLLVSAMCGIQAWLCCEMTSGSFWGGYLAIGLGYLAAIASLARFIKSPSLKGREKNEGFTALAMLVGYITVIAAALTERGLVWTIS